MCGIHTEYFSCGHKSVTENKCTTAPGNPISCPEVEHTFFNVDNWCTGCWNSETQPKFMNGIRATN